jgi:uncharacterized membrane protein
VLAFLLSAVFLDEAVTLQILAGLALITLGVVLTLRAVARPRR